MNPTPPSNKGSDSCSGSTPHSHLAIEQEAPFVDRLRAGDELAYETLVRQYSGRMLAVARRFLGCSDDSADAVQEAFVSVFQAIHAFEGNSTLATWLHRIVVNACLMKVRSRSRRRLVSIDELLPAFDDTGHHVQPVVPWSDSASNCLSQAETQAQVRACIDLLPDDYRSILLLRDIEEIDTQTTAQMLGISVPAVKTRLHRARQALRRLLDPIVRREHEATAV
jgi:RNA polymerase sigma-70 factor (ECF subfamily)